MWASRDSSGLDAGVDVGRTSRSWVVAGMRSSEWAIPVVSLGVILIGNLWFLLGARRDIPDLSGPLSLLASFVPLLLLSYWRADRKGGGEGILLALALLWLSAMVCLRGKPLCLVTTPMARRWGQPQSSRRSSCARGRRAMFGLWVTSCVLAAVWRPDLFGLC